MTLTQLRYVITIADTGSMNEASKALFISQPSLVSRRSRARDRDWSQSYSSEATEGCRLPRKESNFWDTQDKL